MNQSMDEIKKMVTREGFLDVYWSRLQKNRLSGGYASMREIYDQMEKEFRQEYGNLLFPSFSAFRKYLYRHH